MLERLTAKVTEYAAGSTLLGMSFGWSKGEPLTIVVFAVALPAMIYCRWVVEQY